MLIPEVLGTQTLRLQAPGWVEDGVGKWSLAKLAAFAGDRMGQPVSQGLPLCEFVMQSAFRGFGKEPIGKMFGVPVRNCLHICSSLDL
jgi:hypothetical protein